ncbi:MAG: hypothetical protein P8Y58_16345, partial [Novosphingobium sp.]
YGGEPFHLMRTREGRDLSRARYQRAQEFQRSLEPGAPGEWTDFLYFTGIVVQLALSCHLLDVGFPGAWCARHIGLHVDRSLTYANATGFGYECEDTERVTRVLAPYWKWNRMHLIGDAMPNDGDLKPDEVRGLLHAIMDHVREVTGHGPLRRQMKS